MTPYNHGKAAFVNVKRQHPLPTEDTLSRWHYPRYLRAIGFHGIFAPNSKYRALVTPAKRGKGNNCKANCKTGEREPPNLHAAMT